ncbi:MAG: N-acetyl-gamma-glutamyl-phosphate reductase [Longimicrobiales bacterium]
MMNQNANTRSAGIIGATGYTGQELVRLLRSHPGIDLAFATSEAEAGQPVNGNGLRFVNAADAPLAEVDVVFSCLPTGQSGEWALKAAEAGVVSIDLSADLREGEGGAVYGLPELWRSDITCSSLIANPGCYPTGILIAMAPLWAAGFVDGTRPLIADAASGVTGAGRSAKRELLFGEVADDYRAYGVGNVHRHVPEIAMGLERLAGQSTEFVFTPHLLPIRRGILETLYVPVCDGITAADLRGACQTQYADEPFVAVFAEGLPSIRDVAGRNSVALGFADVQNVGRPLVLVMAAFDNLLKGAAGQALQNANLILGLAETEGLSS